MSNKSVEVLCPNGRRVKVKTQPQMTALQILQTVCEKEKEYKEEEYELKHQNKVIPVSSMVRFLNFTNNAKIEMVKSLNPRKGSLDEIVIALQMEDGARYQHNFTVSQTLMDVLKHTEQISGLELVKPEAVCIYMQCEYKGLNHLARTTLKSMGIVSGRAIIRLLFRDDAVIEVASQVIEPNSKKVKRSDSSASAALSAVVIDEHDSNLESSNMVLSGPPPFKIFPDVVEPKSSHIFPESMEDEKEDDCNAEETITSFSEFSNFKFPEPTNEDYTAIDPNQMRWEVQMSMPCDREVIIFSTLSFTNTAEDESRGNEQAECDENFFKLTVDDLRSRLKDLKSELAGKDDSRLMTKAMREKKEMEKISSIKKVPIRFQFPDKTVVQAFFRPLETVKSLKEFLDLYVSEDVPKYEMFTTPPRVFLNDMNATLHKAKLLPSAIIHISTTSEHHSYLRSICLENMRSLTDADDVVSSIRRDAERSNVEPEHDQIGTPRISSASTLSASTSPASTLPKGAPKWFKTGK